MVCKEEVVCVCTLCVCATRTQEKLPRACPLYNLGHIGHLPWHWPYLLPTPAPAFLPYLYITLQPIGPLFNSFLKGHHGILRPQLWKKRTSITIHQSLSPRHPFYGEREPSKKTALGRQVWIPQLFFQRACLYSSLPKLILGLCSSEVTSLGTIQKNKLGDLCSNQTSTINSLFLSFQANPFSFPGITMALRSHSLIHTPHVHLYLPMLRPTMGAPLCPKKSGLGPNLPSS